MPNKVRKLPVTADDRRQKGKQLSVYLLLKHNYKKASCLSLMIMDLGAVYSKRNADKTCFKNCTSKPAFVLTDGEFIIIVF